MNLKELKEMVVLMQENGLTELELEKNGFKVRLKKSSEGVEVIRTKGVAPERHTLIASAPESAQSPALPAAEAEGVIVVRSPMVGTFYSSPAPDKDPYVAKGKTVKEGDVLCIIEAMKLMNEIKSEVGGRVVEILVNNGQPVEFDQPLFKIQKP